MSEDPPGADESVETPRAAPPDDRPRLIQRSIVADALNDPEERRRIGLPPGDDVPLPVVVELNLGHPEGMNGAADRLLREWAQVSDAPPGRISDTYYRGQLTTRQVRHLAQLDLRTDPPAQRRGRRCREHRLRPAEHCAAHHERRSDDDQQRPGQREPGHHGRGHAPRRTAHLRRLVLLLEEPHW